MEILDDSCPQLLKSVLVDTLQYHCVDIRESASGLVVQGTYWSVRSKYRGSHTSVSLGKYIAECSRGGGSIAKWCLLWPWNQLDTLSKVLKGVYDYG